MKVLGGSNKGKRLRVTATGMRPTKAVVRQAIFNIIQDKVIMASVLDIFAGTGSLGIESLCRGADRACFVETHPRILTENLSRLSLSDRSRVLPFDFRRALKKLKGTRYDLIFLDPPYGKRFIPPALRLIDQLVLLKSDGLIMVEHSIRERFKIPDPFRVLKEKRYGETAVAFITHISGGTTPV
jgi:16S rRNA (guanine966-N2)-methyltransferase